MAKRATIEPKKKCCRDKPRCKRCPVVCKRLSRQGLAEKTSDGRFVLSVRLTKQQYKAARSGG
jgi:aldehyde:ferredoxin oxidoreductase